MTSEDRGKRKYQLKRLLRELNQDWPPELIRGWLNATCVMGTGWFLDTMQAFAGVASAQCPTPDHFWDAAHEQVKRSSPAEMSRFEEQRERQARCTEAWAKRRHGGVHRVVRFAAASGPRSRVDVWWNGEEGESVL